MARVEKINKTRPFGRRVIRRNWYTSASNKNNLQFSLQRRHEQSDVDDEWFLTDRYTVGLYKRRHAITVKRTTLTNPLWKSAKTNGTIIRFSRRYPPPGVPLIFDGNKNVFEEGNRVFDFSLPKHCLLVRSQTDVITSQTENTNPIVTPSVRPIEKRATTPSGRYLRVYFVFVENLVFS